MVAALTLDRTYFNLAVVSSAESAQLFDLNVTGCH